jgi:hypothetical protein
MRNPLFLLAMVWWACSGQIEEASGPPGPAAMCRAALAPTSLPKDFKECLTTTGQRPAGTRPERACTVRYDNREFAQYDECMGAARQEPERPVYGGSVNCTIVYFEDGRCDFRWEELQP